MRVRSVPREEVLGLEEVVVLVVRIGVATPTGLWLRSENRSLQAKMAA